jgi:hypothetical protein
MKWFRENAVALLIGIALAVLPILYFLYAQVSWNPLNPHEHLVQNGLAYVSLLLFTFFNHQIFVPRWFLSKQYARYTIIAVVCIAGAVYLPYRIEQFLYFKKPRENTAGAWVKQIFWKEMMFEGPAHHSPPPQRLPRRGEGGPPDMPPAFGVDKPGSSSWMLPSKLAIFFLLGSVSSLASILIQATNRLRQTENDKLQAELSQLKAQIQPHFLFNTLNSIYALAIRNDVRTADTIVKLSEFLRYIIRDAHRDKVPLAMEIQYIANYIELQRARLHDAAQINYQLDGQPNGLMIAPLLLSSFIENAFKYGVNPEEESPIDINLKIVADTLRLTVANNKVQVSKMEESTGIGLRNTKERLRLTYPGAHELIIHDSDTSFSVNLYVELT